VSVIMVECDCSGADTTVNRIMYTFGSWRACLYSLYVLERENFESRQVVPYMELAAFND
jgi:hypothetical protein